MERTLVRVDNRHYTVFVKVMNTYDKSTVVLNLSCILFYNILEDLEHVLIRTKYDNKIIITKKEFEDKIEKSLCDCYIDIPITYIAYDSDVIDWNFSLMVNARYIEQLVQAQKGNNIVDGKEIKTFIYLPEKIELYSTDTIEDIINKI